MKQIPHKPIQKLKHFQIIYISKKSNIFKIIISFLQYINNRNRNSTTARTMLLASVTDILYYSDSYWKHMTLNSLRNLMSTSKGFNSEMKKVSSSATNSTPMIEFALLSMIKNRPDVFNYWVLSFSTANKIFFLSVEQLIEHCAALPVGNPYRLDVDNADDWMSMESPSGIGFIDAFRLTVNSAGGLKSAMERRDRFFVGVMASARRILVSVGDRFEQMLGNVEVAYDALKRDLADLRNDESDGNIDGTLTRSPEDIRLQKGIRRLKKFARALETADMDYQTIRYIVDVATYKNINSLEYHVGEVDAGLRLLVPRYKSYSVKYCRAPLPFDCLPEMK